MTSILSWIKTDETAKDSLTRVVTERPLFFLPPPLQRLPVRAGNVVEIIGPPFSAKTLSLTQAAISCILPKKWKGVQYEGLECGVLFIDLDCRFDVLSLSHALRRKQDEKSNIDCDNELFADCMKRFSYIRCYNSFEFLATLKTLPYLLQNEKEKQGGSQYMLILDSTRTFYWKDHSLEVRTSLTDTSRRKNISLQSVAETVVQEINNLQLQHSIVVLLSRSAAVGDTQSTSRRGQVFESRDPSTLRHHDSMPSVWKSIVSHRVLLHPSGGGFKDQSCGTFVTKWLFPPVNFSDTFIICDVYRMDRCCLYEAVARVIRNEDDCLE